MFSTEHDDTGKLIAVPIDIISADAAIWFVWGLMILLLLAVQRTTDYYARLFAVIWVDLVSIVYRTCIYDRDT